MKGLTAVEHRALKAVAMQFFINGVVVASYVPRLPGIRDKLGISLSMIGIVLAVATGIGLLGSLIQDPIMARVGAKRSLVGGGIALLVLLPLVAISTHWLMLIVVLGLLHVADVVVDVAMNMQGSTLSARRDTPVMNRLHGMWSLGTVVGGVVASLMAAFDVSLTLHLLAASALLAGALLYVAPGLLDAEPDDDASTAAANSTPASRVFIAFAILGGAAILPEMINSDWAAFRLTDDLDASPGVAGIAYVAFTTGMVIGRFSGDQLVARVGSTVVLRWATVFAAAGTLIATLVPSIVASFAGLLVAGLGVSVMFPQLYDAAAQNRRPNKALGGLTAGIRLFLLIAPIVVGTLAASSTFTVGAAIAIVAIPGALLVWLLSSRLTSEDF